MLLNICEADRRKHTYPSSVELRNAIRYRFTVPVAFRWTGPKAHVLKGEGVTRDVSTRGAFIVTPNHPPAGATLRLEIQFDRTNHNLKLISEGLVMRVEHGSLTGEDGFAFETRAFELQRNGWLVEK